MKLEQLSVAAHASMLQGKEGLEITGVCYDSRVVKKGDLFAALPGVKSDGSEFARQAAERGAAAILSEKNEALTHLPQLVVKDARLGLALAAQAFYGYADRKMKMIAVTGTNGKSTTAYLIRHLMKSAGKKCGMLGTIEYDMGSQAIEAPLTTPESVDLHRYLRTMVDAGCSACVMETSSHSLCQHRVAGIDFAAGIFTNLTQDHLDYHRTMEDYRDAKGILFRNLFSNATAVLNLDDATSAYYAKHTPAKVLGFALNDPPKFPLPGKQGAELVGRIRGMDIRGTRFQLDTPWGKRQIQWGLVGAHNVQNCLGAVAAVLSLGLPFDAVCDGLATFQGVPGRLESVGDEYRDLPFRILVDYAHTDDALRSVMRALRELKPSRLISVFGCGGDRDRTKRPKMAKAVEEMADLGIITSDNPRTEDPQAIISDIWKGITQEHKFLVNADRSKAIDLAIKEARPGDVVLIAGKGHENYQIFGKEKRHFSDVEEASAALQRRFGAPGMRGAAAGA
ncbi:MAG TPA: UDP-N-acetylmuramoyl-L-alanyl-D-glutamate--2,6-diaminopimelate ligase [Planctomycetota bacterium]|nr:UDP-N-acetylmuramoyl-L-alanyl-D-glutamate--2,6-diaminopimelate ligase [Planctomycetota bacterium]